VSGSCTRNKSAAEIRASSLIANSAQRAGRHAAAIDYYCWDLYAKTSQCTRQVRLKKTKPASSCGMRPCTQLSKAVTRSGAAELISTAVLRRHLETMLRLDIEYDFLPRESEILHLKFWDAAFEKSSRPGALLRDEGKNRAAG